MEGSTYSKCCFTAVEDYKEQIETSKLLIELNSLQM